jgi:hypothetical protein
VHVLGKTFLPDINLQINKYELETWMMTRPDVRMKAAELQLVGGVVEETVSLTPTLDKNSI